MGAFHERMLRWGEALVVLVLLCSASVSSAENDSTSRHISGERLKTLFQPEGKRSNWYGIYMGGRKVGYAESWTKRALNASAALPRGYEVGLSMTMKVFGGGAADKLTISDVRRYGLKSPHALVYASYHQVSSGNQDKRTYQHEKRGIARVSRLINGRKQRDLSIPVSKESLTDQVLSWRGAGAHSSNGAALDGFNFMWEPLGDVAYKALRQGTEKRVIAGLAVPVSTYRVDHRAIGLVGTMVVMDGGVVLSMGIGKQLELRLEEREVARGDVEGLDVGTAGISVKGVLPNPETLKELALRVELPSGKSMQSRGKRTEVSCRDSSCQVWIRRKAGAVVTPAARKQALIADHAIDHRSKNVRALAYRLSRGIRGKQRVFALLSYVHQKLRKRLATNLPSASAVLEAGYGDCTEHTWAFVAMARALGIAARPVYGLAYVQGERARFAYHAWAEVEVDGVWVEVDPTWGQEQADVGHLALGNDAVAIASYFGGLSIELVAMKH